MALSCDDRKIIHTFDVVVVDVRLESRWLLNEITIREMVEEHVMAANFSSRYMTVVTIKFVHTFLLLLSFD